MKQGRTPDRVHVVRPPEESHVENTSLPARDPRSMEIVRTLAQISDKLKRSEAERYELLAELREYRKALIELEDKAEKTEKAYLTLENQIKHRDTIEQEVSQRQARFERALKDTENKLVQASASQNLLDQRLKSTEDAQTGLVQRIDQSVSEQARLDRQFEKVTQDRSRVLRKVERMEEILTETQDTLKARALILLTDQSAAAQAVALPRIAAMGETDDLVEQKAAWWRRSIKVQGVGMVSMVVAALLFGWTINQIQQPDIPKIAVLENGGLAKLNLQENRWEPIAGMQGQPDAAPSGKLPDISAPAQDLSAEIAPTPVSAVPENTSAAASVPEQTPGAQAVLNASDEALMTALENDPDQLAAQLNEIAPNANTETGLDHIAGKTVEPSAVKPVQSAQPAQKGYDPLLPLRDKAFAQDATLAKEIAAEKSGKPLLNRIQPDPALPEQIKILETQAFAGVPEAQHDLAAIYTAGRGGVAQDFEKAAFWFREAADHNVANADYNLGVLYHQGLGVERDLPRALYWYREAARLGHPEAQYNLGIAYIEGIGADYNPVMAAAFFESSANQGIVEAAYNLGLIYENGLLNDKAKSDEALLWYKIAADGGNADARAALQQMASSMQIGMEDVSKMADRMQAIYTSNHGRPAGKDAKPASASEAQTPRSPARG